MVKRKPLSQPRKSKKMLMKQLSQKCEKLYCETEKGNNSSFSVTGRRIINISYFFRYDCSFFDLNLISEKIEGLQSIFSFQCAVCNIIQTVKTDDPSEKHSSNLLAVLGALSTGIGYSQFSEVLAAMNIPSLSHKTYTKYHNQLSGTINNKNKELLINAGKEEALLAIQSGNVTSDGVPVISVIVDGAWSKRSYRTNYNASSGVACIIGAKTKKMLYMGVRNKYCYVCARSSDTAKDHKCYKNWDGSSAAMEADIICEGFEKSLQMHNLIYGKVIGDGDSSVYRKLTAAAPYGPTFIIEKIECRNHFLKNYLNKLADISKETKFPSSLRKKVTSEDSLGRFRIAVTKAIEYRKKETNFFFHSKFKNLVPELQACGLFEVIKTINARLANNAINLLHDVDTNAAETYNSIIAKFVGGKRINFSLKGSYETRCIAAAISYNTYGDFIRVILSELSKDAPGLHLETFCTKRKKAKETRQKGKSLKRKTFATSDTHYGPEASEFVPDIDEEIFLVKRNKFLQSLEQADKDAIFQNKILQSGCNVWQKPDARIEDVKKKINSLRSCFRKEYKKVINSKRSGTGTEDVYKPTLWYFDLLLFLKDDEMPRTSIGTDDEDFLLGLSQDDSENIDNIEEDERENGGINPQTPEDIPSTSSSAVSSLSHNKYKKRQKPSEECDKVLKLVGEKLQSSKPDDECDLISKTVAEKLRRLSPDMKLYADKLINDVLFHAQLGPLHRYALISIPPQLNQQTVTLTQLQPQVCNFYNIMTKIPSVDVNERFEDYSQQDHTEEVSNKEEMNNDLQQSAADEETSIKEIPEDENTNLQEPKCKQFTYPTKT
ncbi:hypothetical protein RN001_005972 [Aquatica leii]|uniref:Uncharacterized protein n=1 Tax=Aquatica leii TaxID=1421715 RepID=A0AAN7PDF4_9COLE|nr:hypothetical protein RN001_005972 [Aquatica leii]